MIIATELPSVGRGSRIPAETVYGTGLLGLLSLLLLAPPRLWSVLAVSAGVWLLLTAALRPARSAAGLGAFVALFAAFIRMNVAGVSGETQAIGIVVVGVGLTPFLLRPIRQFGAFPFAHLFCLVTALYVTVGLLFSRPTNALSVPITEANRRQGFVWMGVFLAAVVLGWLLVRPGGAPVQSVEWHLDRTRAAAIGIGCFVVRMVLDLAGLPSSLGQAPRLLLIAEHTALLLLVAAWTRRRLGGRWVLVVPAIAVAEFVLGFGTGALYAGLTLSVALLALFLGLRCRVPWATVTVLIAIAVPLNVAKEDVRTELRVTDSRLSVASAGRAVIRLPDLLSSLTKEQLSDSAGRFSYSAGDLLGYLTEVVPKQQGYWDKRTYRFVPLAILPRAVAPWKPVTLSGNEFGREFGLLGQNDTVTSANLPFVAEAYVNFGHGGIVAVGMLLGVLFAFLGRFMRRDNPVAAVAAASVAGLLVGGVESDTSVVMGLVPWALVTALVVARRLVTEDRA